MFVTAAASSLVIFLWKKLEKKREGYGESSGDGGGDGESSGDASWLAIVPVLVAVVIAAILFGAFAVYLSWTSNSLIGWGAFAKVVFAFFAFLNGLGYLITHLVNKLDLIAHIKRSAPPPTPPGGPMLPMTGGGGLRGSRRRGGR